MFDYETLRKEAQPSFLALELSVRYERLLLGWRPDVTPHTLALMSKASLGRIPGIGEKGVREIYEAVQNYFTPGLPLTPPKETKLEEYARRQAEALEHIEAATVEALVELRRKDVVTINQEVFTGAEGLGFCDISALNSYREVAKDLLAFWDGRILMSATTRDALQPIINKARALGEPT